MKTFILSIIIVPYLIIICNYCIFAEQFEINENDAIELGRGFDLLSGETRNDCVTREESSTKSTSKVIEFKLLKIEDYLTLSRELNISASTSLKGYGTGKAGFVNSQALSKYSIYVLAKVTVKMKPRTIRDVRMKQDFADALSNYGDDHFRTLCGDEFIYSVIKGGEFFAIITIETTNEKEKKDITTELEGSFGIFSSAGKFKSSLEKIATHSEIKIYQYLKGGNTIIKTDPDAIIQSAASFSSNISAENAYPYLASTEKYEITFLKPPTKSPIDIANQKDIINRMSSKRYHYLMQLSNINYILENPEEFIQPKIEDLSDQRNKINENLNKVHKAASVCFDNYKTCSLPTDLEDLQLNLPKRKEKPDQICYKKSSGPVCGIKNYNKKRDPKCGVELYKKGRGPVCGIEKYKLQRSPECGVELYKSGTVITGSRNIQGRNCPKGWTKTGSYEDNTWMIESEGGHHSKARPIKMSTCVKYKTIRKPEFGVERYKECRLPAHGIESYRECRSPHFEVELYRECEDEDFGVSEYNECRHPSFGIINCEKCKDCT